MGSYIKVIKKCSFCGNDFTAHTLHTKYCSHVCNQKHYKKLKREEKLQVYLSTPVVSQQKESAKPVQFDPILQQKQFLSIEETALLLGASRRTIQRLIAKSSLKAGKLGSRSIIKRNEIDKLFK